MKFIFKLPHGAILTTANGARLRNLGGGIFEVDEATGLPDSITALRDAREMGGAAIDAIRAAPSPIQGPYEGDAPLVEKTYGMQWPARTQ